MRLRQANESDKEFLLSVRNHPFIRERSTNPEPVGTYEHEDWFKEALADPDQRVWIVQRKGTKLGVFRVKRCEPSVGVLTVHILPEFTGKGVGLSAIRAGCTAAATEFQVERIMAYVREDNPLGLKAFAKAGFTIVERADDCPLHHVAFCLFTDARGGIGSS